MTDKILLWFFLSVPEGIMMAWAGTGLLGIKRSMRQLILAGLLIGTTVVLLRSIVPAGFHIPFTVTSVCIILVLVLKVGVKTAIAACFIASFLINLGQVAILPPVFGVLGFSWGDSVRTIWLHIGFGWLCDLLLLAATVLAALGIAPFRKLGNFFEASPGTTPRRRRSADT